MKVIPATKSAEKKAKYNTYCHKISPKHAKLVHLKYPPPPPGNDRVK